MDVTIEEAADAVEMIVADGVEAAMNRYNGREHRRPTEPAPTGGRGSTLRLSNPGARPRLRVSNARSP